MKGAAATGQATEATGRDRVPRVARLLALAHHFEGLIRGGDVRDYAELARVGHVSRARLTQIMDLLLLAPEIQEEVLFLAPVVEGRDPVDERGLRRVVGELEWRRQRRLWNSM